MEEASSNPMIATGLQDSNVVGNVDKHHNESVSHTSDSEYILQQWVRDTCKSKGIRPDSFIDGHGVRRYLHNGEEVDELDHIDDIADEATASETHFRSGTSAIALEGSVKKEVVFVRDFKKLWNKVALNPNEVCFSRIALFFETCCKASFDPRMARRLMVLTCYDTLMYIIVMFMQPARAGSQLINVSVVIASYCAYVACALVFKASLEADLLTSTSVLQTSGEEKGGKVYSNKSIATFRLLYSGVSSRFPLIGLLRIMVRSMLSEATSFVLGRDLEGRYANNAPSGAGRGGNEGAGTDSCGGSGVGDAIELGGVGHAASVPPVLSTSSEDRYMSSASAARTPSKLSGAKNAVRSRATTCQCSYYLLLVMGSSCLSEVYSQQSSYNMSISRGTSFALVLAIIVIPLFTLLMYTVNLLRLDCIFPATSLINNVETASCPVQYFEIIFSVGTMTVFLVFVMCVLALMIAMIGLSYGGSIMHALAVSWVRRYAPLRRFSWARTSPVHETTPIGGEDRSKYDEFSVMIDGVKSSCSKAQLVDGIKQDAFENYLFIQEYSKQISAIWSPMLCITTVVCLIYYAAILWVFFAYRETSLQTFFLVWLLALFSFFLLFPLYCMAYANDAMDTIRTSFRLSSAPNDFEIIGGKETWIAFLEQAPAYWTFLGVPVTWTSLYSICAGLLGTALAAGGGAALTFIK